MAARRSPSTTGRPSTARTRRSSPTRRSTSRPCARWSRRSTRRACPPRHGAARARRGSTTRPSAWGRSWPRRGTRRPPSWRPSRRCPARQALADVLPDLFGVRRRPDLPAGAAQPERAALLRWCAADGGPDGGLGRQAHIGDARDTSDPGLYRVGRWDKVEGNPFHDGKLRLSTATFAPDWSVSGEELLRGGSVAPASRSTASSRSTSSRSPTCCASPDPSRPGSTAPSTPPTSPRSGGRLRHLPRQRGPQGPQPVDRPGLRRPLFEPGQQPGEDRVATRLRPRRGTSRSGCATPTSRPRSPTSAWPATSPTPTHDYVAVFNQNTNISKSDYWQKRSVTSDVAAPRGRLGRGRLTISVFNDSPPYGENQIYGDNRGGSSRTRWNGMTLGVFLPDGVEITSATAAGRSLGTDTFDYYGRPYKLVRLVLPPQHDPRGGAEYVVPAAAVATGDDLTYRLDATPQGMVTRRRDGQRPVAQGLRRHRAPRGLDARRAAAGRRTTTPDSSRSRASASPAPPRGHAAP